MDIPRVDWSDFLDSLNWKQGEHVSLIGPTGAGKTTLSLALLPKRKYVVVVGTKPRDATLSKLIGQGYKKVARFPDHVPLDITQRLIVWPPFKGPADVKRQRVVVRDLLMEVFAQGGWAVMIDELRYVSETLRLRSLLELIWQQGRSMNVSLIGGTQRPAFVPLMAYDQASHLFLWRDNDEANLKRIGGLGGLDAKIVRETVAGLDRHEVLYLNTRDATMARTTVTL